VISHLERLNSNDKMDGSDPHFDAESIATHNTSWDLEKDDVQADPVPHPGKADTAGRDERRRRPAVAPGCWRQHVQKESARNTGSPNA
jgi:hypothetical protein